MWILPTYNRPALLEQTLRLCAETGVSTKGLILVNGCWSPEYEKAVTFAPPGWDVEYLPENLGWAQACNYAFEKYPDELWYGFFYDDMKPITRRWDKKLVKGCNQGRIVSAVNNWHKPHRIQTAVVNGDLAREVGFLTLPGTWACYTDDFWERLGTELNIWTAREDIVVETLSPRKGDYEFDDAHNTAYTSGKLEEDGHVWEAFIQTRYLDIRDRVRDRFKLRGKRETVLKGNSVYIATPCADGKMSFYYTLSVVQSIPVMSRHGIGWTVHVLDKSSLVDYARNRLIAEFLKTDATHLLFIDDDMGWPEHAIPELLAHDKDVIAAVGITKDEDPEMRRFCVDMHPSTTKYDATRGIIAVKQVGTGFMLIKRHVLEKMWAHYNENPVPAPREKPELGEIHWVFEFDKGNPDGWGEDYTFCRRWRELGGEIWIDPSIQLIHAGQYAYTGTYLQWLQDKHEKETKDGRNQAA